MTDFPTPTEVKAMREKDKKEVEALVDRFIAHIKSELAGSRETDGKMTCILVPPGLLRKGETWRTGHTEELHRRIVAAGWYIPIGGIYADSLLQCASLRIAVAIAADET